MTRTRPVPGALKGPSARGGTGRDHRLAGLEVRLETGRIVDSDTEEDF
jgi:hypothetical protein